MGGPGVASKVFGRADKRVPAQVTDSSEEVSPFDLVLTHRGDGFAIMQMHIKLALYEHQSAGALAGLLLALRKCEQVFQDPSLIKRILIGIYNPAADIICQPARWNPTTREAADHSCPFLVGSLLKKALAAQTTEWEAIMLTPLDFSETALQDPAVRAWMEKVGIEHRPEFDDKYPEGIPTEVTIELLNGSAVTSDLVMFPPGHAAYTGEDFGPDDSIVRCKHELFGELAFGDARRGREIIARYAGIGSMDAEALRGIHSGYEVPDRSELMR